MMKVFLCCFAGWGGIMRLSDDIVTLYNAYYDKANDCTAYTRTVIRGASWYVHSKSTVDKDGLKAANEFIVRIPADADFGGKSYLPPSAFDTLKSPSDVFTFKGGDFIVKGVCDDENPVPAHMRKAYDAVMTILAVTDNRRAPNAKHWKVVGA